MQMYQTSLGLTAGMRLTTERGGPYRLLGISAPFTFQIMGFDMLIIYHQSVVVVSIEYIDEPHSLGHTPSISPIGRDDDGMYGRSRTTKSGLPRATGACSWICSAWSRRRRERMCFRPGSTTTRPMVCSGIVPNAATISTR